MPLTLKIKYFNTFILREEPTITTAVVQRHTVDASDATLLGPSATIIVARNSLIAAGMVVHGPGISKKVTIASVSETTTDSVSTTTIVLNSPDTVKIEKGVTLTFSNENAYPSGSSQQQGKKEWHIEESRIKGGFNEKTVDFGAKAFIVDKKYNRNHRKNAMIYSGIYNSRTEVNDTNQFSIGENITKAVDSIHGSIQKLYAEDTNLLIFQENKVNNALIDKDAIFTAEGGNISTAAKIVIGQITPYLGEYGIGKNPESFAVYGFRKYFVDKDRGAVLRLSRDGLTEISSYGMKSFFRDHLQVSNKAYGMFDINSKKYILSLHLNRRVIQNKQTFINNKLRTVTQSSRSNVLTLNSIDNSDLIGTFIKQEKATAPIKVISTENNKVTLTSSLTASSGDTVTFIPDDKGFGITLQQPLTGFKTICFDDRVNGWSSFLTYKPFFGGSIANNFYTWNTGDLYKHHYTNSDKNTFYGVFQPSTITIISNQNPSLVKHYKTINYEGTNNWKVIELKSPADDDNDYSAYPIPGNITGRYIDPLNGVSFAGFTPLEKKYYANIIIDDRTSITGISSLTTTGVKGFFTEATLEHQPVNNNKTLNKGKHAELFSVGFNYEQSLY
tara:strand:- start:538 stop:2382 length:1845 start_codon:yes stop_codon:yes gene_type:complete